MILLYYFKNTYLARLLEFDLFLMAMDIQFYQDKILFIGLKKFKMFIYCVNHLGNTLALEQEFNFLEKIGDKIKKLMLK